MNIELQAFSHIEKRVLIELMKEIETLALKYELKQPKNCIGCIGGF